MFTIWTPDAAIEGDHQRPLGQQAARVENHSVGVRQIEQGRLVSGLERPFCLAALDKILRALHEFRENRLGKQSLLDSIRGKGIQFVL
jgi:hypothetical protein